jgi:hypothetical protein
VELPVKRLILTLVFALLPSAALAQGQTIKVDCTAYHRNSDGLWAVTHANVIVQDGKPITVGVANACCFGADRSRLVVGGVNIINIVEKACF